MEDLTAGAGGMPRVVLTAGKSRAEVYLNGATVTQCEIGGRQLLFCSRTSPFVPGKPIRGGVPVIFPWFGPHPTDPALPQHGIVRAREWTLLERNETPTGIAQLVLGLTSTDETRQLWSHEFALRYIVELGSALQLTLEVANRGAKPFRFEEALHSYLSCSDARGVEITGLDGTEYFDKTDGMARKRQQGPVVLCGETDRVYVDTEADCVLQDPVRGKLRIRKSGSRTTVVWNPGETKAEPMADLAGGQWPGFACIETANALHNAITLAPGETHVMRVEIADQTGD